MEKGTHGHTGRGHVNRGRDWSKVATSQGTPGITRAGRGKEESSPKARESSPADTFISGFWAPDLGEDTFVQPPVWVDPDASVPVAWDRFPHTDRSCKSWASLSMKA